MEYTIAVFEDGIKMGEFPVSSALVIALLIDANRLQSPNKVEPQKAEKAPKAKKETKAEKVRGEGDVEDAAPKKFLTDAQKEKIEDMLKDGVSVQEICNEVGVSNPTVYVIRSRMKQNGDLPMD